MQAFSLICLHTDLFNQRKPLKMRRRRGRHGGEDIHATHIQININSTVSFLTCRSTHTVIFFYFFIELIALKKVCIFQR